MGPSISKRPFLHRSFIDPIPREPRRPLAHISSPRVRSWFWALLARSPLGAFLAVPHATGSSPKLSRSRRIGQVDRPKSQQWSVGRSPTAAQHRRPVHTTYTKACWLAACHARMPGPLDGLQWLVRQPRFTRTRFTRTQEPLHKDHAVAPCFLDCLARCTAVLIAIHPYFLEQSNYYVLCSWQHGDVDGRFGHGGCYPRPCISCVSLHYGLSPRHHGSSSTLHHDGTGRGVRRVSEVGRIGFCESRQT